MYTVSQCHHALVVALLLTLVQFGSIHSEWQNEVSSPQGLLGRKGRFKAMIVGPGLVFRVVPNISDKDKGRATTVLNTQDKAVGVRCRIVDGT
jgi:hypothetical protein